MSGIHWFRGAMRHTLQTAFGWVEETDDGLFFIRNHSAFVLVELHAWGDDVVVSVWSRVLADVPSSPRLCEYVALSCDTYPFGHLGLRRTSAAHVDVMFRHSLLAATVDAELLVQTIASVALAADQLDDVLQSQFGGRRGTEHAPRSRASQSPGYL